MANLEKHQKNSLREWLAGEESAVPTRSRSVSTLGAYIKIPKPASKKARPVAGPQPAQQTEPALMRDPAPPAKAEARQTQAASREHLLKQERLTSLRRAPFRYK